MAKEVKLKVLSVKSLTNLMVKEMDTDSAKSYERLEYAMQQTYAITEENQSIRDIDSGSIIAVNVSPNPSNKRQTKMWLRAVVRNVYQSIGPYLYDVLLVDYGTEAMVSGKSVRQLKNHFTEEFVGHQVLNFHLIDVVLKPGVNTDGNIKLVEDMFKLNNWIVLANIKRQVKTNLSGDIRFENGLDLSQFLVLKGLANEKEVEFRSPKSVPVFKNIAKLPSNQKQLNCNHFDSSTETKRNSVSSVSSTDLSIISDSSIESVNSSFETDINIKEDNPKPKGRFAQLFAKVKERQMQKSCGSNETTTVSSGSGRTNTLDESLRESPVDYSVHFNSKPDHKEIDWQLNDNQESPKIYSNIRPAGILPPPHVFQRILTLKK